MCSRNPRVLSQHQVGNHAGGCSGKLLRNHLFIRASGLVLGTWEQSWGRGGVGAVVLLPAYAVIHKQPSSAVVLPLPGWEACGGGRPRELRINVTVVMRG